MKTTHTTKHARPVCVAIEGNHKVITTGKTAHHASARAYNKIARLIWK